MKKLFVLILLLVLAYLAISYFRDNARIRELLADKDPLCSIQQPEGDRCEGVNLGAEFNPETQQCGEVSWGCSAPPFESVAACQVVCEN